MKHRLAALCALLPLAAAAQAPVELPGRVSDADFYRAVACAAPPGGACQQPLLRWDSTRPIRVALRRIDPAFLGRPKLRADAALERALQAMKEAGAGFRLVRVGAHAPAEVEIFFLDISRGAPVTGTGIAGLDGTPLDAALTRVFVERDTGRIERAAIIFSTALETPAYEGAVLGQLTRAMGLVTPVRSPAYAGVSVLSQTGPKVKVLGLQDIAALRRHYARN